MEWVLFIFALYGAYVLWNGILKGGLLNIQIPFVTNRGLLAVKAAWYLILVEDDATAEEANVAVSYMNIDMEADMIRAAQDFIQMCYGGKQLPLIAEARAKGFEG
ncbi:MAG: hypothetical protein R3E13_02980 [Alphaproteobacteria bacterium]